MPPTVSTAPPPPSSDKRWRIVETTMRRQGFDDTALIESLHSVQQAFGFLDEPAMRYIAKALHVPLSKVYGVATFYHYFTLKPQGKHACIVCLGTACYIKGSGQILKALSERYKISEGQTTPDGELSLLSARCIGACGLAPATVIDGDVLGKSTPETVHARLETITTSAKAQPAAAKGSAAK
jgi:bidirectional [NiFe] hydrogenase diaphorase subunit